MIEFAGPEVAELLKVQPQPVEVVDRFGVTQGGMEAKGALRLFSLGGFVATGELGQVSFLRGVWG